MLESETLFKCMSTQTKRGAMVQNLPSGVAVGEYLPINRFYIKKACKTIRHEANFQDSWGKSGLLGVATTPKFKRGACYSITFDLTY